MLLYFWYKKGILSKKITVAENKHSHNQFGYSKSVLQNSPVFVFTMNIVYSKGTPRPGQPKFQTSSIPLVWHINIQRLWSTAACYKACPYTLNQFGIRWNCRVSLMARNAFKRQQKQFYWKASILCFLSQSALSTPQSTIL